MPHESTLQRALAGDILNRVESLLSEATSAEKPLEVDPFRGQLFELFVTADASGFLEDGGDPDLTADGLCRSLAERWGLAAQTRDAFETQTRLPPAELARMRMLWSLLRMWMEWQYAWSRWREFHEEVPPENGARDA